jgi:hypothetical protein
MITRGSEARADPDRRVSEKGEGKRYFLRTPGGWCLRGGQNRKLLNVTFLVSLVHVREASTTTPLDRIALGNPSPASTPKPALPECNRTRRGATSQRFEYRNPSDLHSSPAPGCSQVRREARRPIALRYVAPVPP